MALTVFQRCLADDKGKASIETDVHASVLNDKSPQDSDTVLAMLISSLELYKKAHPQVTEVYLRSDNAGCYHSNKTILGLWSHRNKIPGLTIKGYCFSEACGGKSRCDTVSIC